MPKWCSGIEVMSFTVLASTTSWRRRHQHQPTIQVDRRHSAYLVSGRLRPMTARSALGVLGFSVKGLTLEPIGTRAILRRLEARHKDSETFGGAPHGSFDENRTRARRRRRSDCEFYGQITYGGFVLCVMVIVIHIVANPVGCLKCVPGVGWYVPAYQPNVRSYGQTQ